MLQVSEAKPTGIAVELLGFELKKAEAEARQRSEKAAADQSACFAFSKLPSAAPQDESESFQDELPRSPRGTPVAGAHLIRFIHI